MMLLLLPLMDESLIYYQLIEMLFFQFGVYTMK